MSVCVRAIMRAYIFFGDVSKASALFIYSLTSDSSFHLKIKQLVLTLKKLNLVNNSGQVMQNL